ncbi:hypothetical protein M2152_002782 [Microbacteriaceae bacterium SG_E_30_P1]|uniref:UvrD-like helicase ATP-binding domain-containing protein n=1 Tax=Antiquaquibacter oligotrophicus TaxID=2880260 RepID=A0ABT6KRK6_9MICO|nr:RNA polymerase recycling motor ATPase HelR [Antiquaquibacter oligotrophicus]MDH6182600.1 hypothetical protein [Antiquaquibacter oligotrophicus]UDF14435.1 AAA family ATPase [Antiquaquibacter oligotrophicus]
MAQTERPSRRARLEPALNTTFFDLPLALTAKRSPNLIAGDEAHFAAIAAAIEQERTHVAARLDELRRRRGDTGAELRDRDDEIRRLSSRMSTLERYGAEACLGRIVPEASAEADPEPLYIGRIGLTDASGIRLLVDWRTPAAEPFFAATHANALGLASRRRFRWSSGRVVDYWDEVFDLDSLGDAAALDDHSSFIASLASTRSPRMRDVLGTIQADQDAIIRQGARGPLVVDGGPGTGKTVVALHRTAYLLYANERIRAGGVLVIGPSPDYLAYVHDVLPSLGENSVQTCTLRDLVPEGRDAATDGGLTVASSLEMVRAVEAAVDIAERPPTRTLTVETPWGDAVLGAREWAEAFAAPEPGLTHNAAREQVWAAIVEIIADQVDAAREEDTDDFDAYDLVHDGPRDLERTLAANELLRGTVARSWPLLGAADLVAQLRSDPGVLSRIAPWLSDSQVRSFQREHPYRWTVEDLPLLDAAHRRLGDPGRADAARRWRAAEERERARMAQVTAELIANDDSDMGVMSMLRGQDLRSALVDRAALSEQAVDSLAGPFAHIVIDEAQELTDAQWQMVLARCPSRSITVVGDRAQARQGFVETWEERLARVGFGDAHIATLRINYRTPSEVMAVAAPEILAVLPDANVPESIRAGGEPVIRVDVSQIQGVVADWLKQHEEGVACVIGAPWFEGGPRVRSLTPTVAKGLEFDLVVVVEPASFGDGIAGAVDRYVAMTRATGQLVVASSALDG